MKYIRSIEIINFQSHKNTKISFENGLNVISGPSDNGKSAIIRALKWVLYNEPKGTDFITQGENSCRVSITLSDGTIVARERSGGKNIYRLGDQEGNETTFEGFGGDIPPEILKAHGILKLHIDSSASQCINIADQLEAPFLISQPGSVKAKAIGKLVGVNVIDEAIKELTKEVSSIQSQERSVQGELEGIKEQLKAYEGLPRVKEYLDIKENKITVIKDKSRRYKRLMELKESLKLFDLEINKNKQIVKSLQQVDKAAALIIRLEEDSSRAIRIERMAISYRNVEKDIKEQKCVLQSTKNVDECILKVTDAYERCLRYNQLSVHSNRLSIVSREISSLRSILQGLKSIDKAAEYNERLFECMKRLDSLSVVKKSYDTISDSIRKGQEYTKRFIKIDNADRHQARLEKLRERHEKLIGLQELISEQNREMALCRRDIQACDTSMLQHLEEYKQVLKAVGRCPVCFSPIDEHTMEDIVREFEGGRI